MKHLLLVVLLSYISCSSQKEVRPSYSAVITNLSSDFDFTLGEWNVQNQRRKVWLANNDEWITFPASCANWKQLDGMIVMGECEVMRNGQRQRGATIRIYNSTNQEWTMYWAGTAFPQAGLLYQVKGKFTSECYGEFFGEETYQGKSVKLRFTWRQQSADAYDWEQAYFDKANQEWEVNWKMHFTRK